jgi:cell division protein FtsB
LVAYFGYFALYGSHGIVRYVELSHAVTLKSAELAAIEAERSALERRVSMLRTESIDPDLLEERARDSLGLTEPGEVVILRPKS